MRAYFWYFKKNYRRKSKWYWYRVLYLNRRSSFVMEQSSHICTLWISLAHLDRISRTLEIENLDLAYICKNGKCKYKLLYVSNLVWKVVGTSALHFISGVLDVNDNTCRGAIYKDSKIKGGKKQIGAYFALGGTWYCDESWITLQKLNSEISGISLEKPSYFLHLIEQKNAIW